MTDGDSMLKAFGAPVPTVGASGRGHDRVAGAAVPDGRQVVEQCVDDSTHVTPLGGTGAACGRLHQPHDRQGRPVTHDGGFMTVFGEDGER
jgi:hypothetical protein